MASAALIAVYEIVPRGERAALWSCSKDVLTKSETPCRAHRWGLLPSSSFSVRRASLVIISIRSLELDANGWKPILHRDGWGRTCTSIYAK